MNWTSGGVEQETLDPEAQKAIRQREWEEARKREEKQPQSLKAENYDPRSLFERLQEQKDKKQEEFDEIMKFKNQIQYLDEEDVRFLQDKAIEEDEKETARWQEEMDAVKAFRAQQLSAEEKKAQSFNVSGAKETVKPSSSETSSLAPAKKKERLALGALVKPKGVVSQLSGQKRSSVDSSDDSHKMRATADKRPKIDLNALHQHRDHDGGDGNNTDTSNDARSLGTSILANYGSDSDNELSE